VDSALKKLGEDQRNGRVGEWFTRFNVTVSAADLATFRRTCLDPLLENLLDDYEWWAWCHGTETHSDHHEGEITAYDYLDRIELFPHHRSRHLRTPYHYDPVAEGAAGDVDSYLDTGSIVGLRRATTLFPELEGGG
jgi:hypothetical protein